VSTVLIPTVALIYSFAT